MKHEMEKIAYIQLIVRYLNGQMASEEREAFEQALNQNEELSQVYYSYISRISVKQELDELVRKNDLPMRSAGRNKKQLLFKIAALILLLLIPTVFLINEYLFSTHSLITEDNMKYYVENTRGNNDLAFQLQNEAFRSYQHKEYEKAAKLFTQLSDTAETAGKYHLYAGICLLWSGEQTDIELAHFKLLKVMQSNNQYSRAAQWYYALTLFERGQKEEAKKIFIQFANDTSAFKKMEAETILKDNY